MSTNGKRRPPRPEIQLVAPGTGPKEAAAIAAALEQFLKDTAPIATHRRGLGGWERAARAEAVGDEIPDPWGRGVTWGS
jgi:hypothetical protein